MVITVADEAGQAIPGVAAVVNGQVAREQQPGVLVFSTVAAIRYQVRVFAPSYFTTLHNFSEQERKWFNGAFPRITLVRKIPGRVMLAFGGDTMLGRRYHQPNQGDPRLLGAETRLRDSKTLLKPIKPYLDLATYVSVNLESPVFGHEPTQRSSKSVTFFSYPETLDALRWAGVDHVSLGNNHTYDYLGPGLEATLQHLADSTLGYSGAGMTEAEALRPYRKEIEGAGYNFFSYVDWEGRVFPSQVAVGKTKGGAALGTIENIRASIETTLPGEVTIVANHGSEEYSFQPGPRHPREIAHGHRPRC